MERRNGRQGHLTGWGTAYKQWAGDTKIFLVSPKIFVPGHEDGLHLAVLLGLEVALLAGDVLQQLPGLGPAGLHTTLGWMGRVTASCAAGGPEIRRDRHRESDLQIFCSQKDS